MQQFGGSMLPHDPMLRKRDHLDVNHAAKLIANVNEGAHCLQARFAVYVGKCPDVEVALNRC